MPPTQRETARFISAWMQLRQVIQAANFNRFQKAGLSATQFMTMNVVPPEGITLSELARRLNLSAATLNATVNSLEERGFLHRSRHPGDARKTDICVTSEGETMQNAASQEFHAFMSGLLAQMKPGRRTGLLAGLEQMLELAAPASRAPAATRRAGGAPPAKRSSPRSPRP